MARICIRAALVAIGFAIAVGLAGRPAPAALDMVIGDKNVVKNEPLSSCNSKAQSALISVLGKAAEYGETGSWEGYGATDGSGNSFATAAIHCYPLDDVNGYLVTFTCAAQTPPADRKRKRDLHKLATAFGGPH